MVTFDNEFRFKSEYRKKWSAGEKRFFFLEPMIRTSYKNQTLSRCFFFFFKKKSRAESIKVVRGFLTTTKEFFKSF